MERMSRTADKLHRNHVTLLMRELELGQTLARIALKSRGPGKRKRNRENARKAYAAVCAWRKGIHLTETERAEVDRGLERLASDLEALGESFSHPPD